MELTRMSTANLIKELIQFGIEVTEEERKKFEDNDVDGETVDIGLTESMISFLFEGSFKKQAKFHRFVQQMKETVTLTLEPVPVESQSRAGASNISPSTAFPAFFEVPKFPFDVQAKLDRKECRLTSSDRNKIIRTLYPTTEEYVQVAKALTLRYPFLKDKEGNGYHTWHMSLKRKFKFERTPLAEVEEVKRLKQKFGHSKKSLQPEESSCKEITRPLEINAVGEDATSIEGHVKVLQDQYRRTQPETHIVEDRMRRTFAWRRQEITSGMTVEDVVNKYPFLKSPSGLQLYQEIGFLYKCVQLSRHFREHFGHITSSVLRLAQGKSPLAKLHKEAREESLCEDHLGIDFKAALLMLPALFREKLEHFIVLGESEPSSPYPTVQVQETTDWKTVFTRRVTAVIKVDGIEICQANGVDEGALAAFCAYFVFNLTYPSHLKNTLVFLQRYVLKLTVDGDKPLPTPVTRIINLL
ncbi:sterile alpha motif domain-containing protein 3-like isoform X4 [Carassius auratus]|uniref:Sterile alpha motif domain-containing protein 3-like isoform X4 n=1 Tax=Carassius auratus TaxID=7957 RepID=A0A6P6NNK1_CARAU|nr:sterile alpha motif domain-containing protein 3-like isoform X4 [Carassius auratus]